MITARCFGGVLDGTWRAIDGRELIAPVMDWWPALTLDAGDPREPHMRVHRYTLQKFVVGYRPWGQHGGIGHEPILFHALIGPGFTVKMVAAWLQGWVEEADKLTKEAEKMQTRPGDKARAEVAELERRIENQRDYIDEFRAERDEARRKLENALRTVEGYSLDRNKLQTELKGAHEAVRRGRQEIMRLTQERDEARERCDEVVRRAQLKLNRPWMKRGGVITVNTAARFLESVIDAALGR